MNYSRDLLSEGFPGDSDSKNLHAMKGTQVRFLRQEDPLEKGMATHSIPGEFQDRGASRATIHGVTKNQT